MPETPKRRLHLTQADDGPEFNPRSCREEREESGEDIAYDRERGREERHRRYVEGVDRSTFFRSREELPEPPDTDPMTAERMRWCLETIGWSQKEVAWQLRVRPENIHHMARGSRPIHPNMAVWLNKLAAFHKANPAPEGWNNGKANKPSRVDSQTFEANEGDTPTSGA